MENEVSSHFSFFSFLSFSFLNWKNWKCHWAKLKLALAQLKPRCRIFPTRFRCPNLDWNFKIFRTKFGLILNLSKNDHSNKNALPCRCVKISLIQANFEKLWPSLNLVRTVTTFSSFGTNTSKNTLVPKLENLVSVRTKIRLGHTFPKLTWIIEIFILRHGNAFLIK